MVDESSEFPLLYYLLPCVIDSSAEKLLRFDKSAGRARLLPGDDFDKGNAPLLGQTFLPFHII